MYTKIRLYKTLNLFIFCKKRLYKSKLCMVKSVQKMHIKFQHIADTKNVFPKLVQKAD